MRAAQSVTLAMSSSAPATDPVATRGRGRPRSVAADEAILEATRAVLAEDGWAALTVEGVAARAGVAKTTVYRRFSSRADLAVAAVAQLVAAARTAPGNGAAEDISNAIRACAGTVAVAGAGRRVAGRACSTMKNFISSCSAPRHQKGTASFCPAKTKASMSPMTGAWRNMIAAPARSPAFPPPAGNRNRTPGPPG